MKKLLVFIMAITTISSISAATHTAKSVDFYQDSSCTEMTNLYSEDEFIRFAAKEIISDLGQDVCSKVQSLESLEFGELAGPEQISAVQFGKLIESIHTIYISE